MRTKTISPTLRRNPILSEIVGVLAALPVLLQPVTALSQIGAGILPANKNMYVAEDFNGDKQTDYLVAVQVPLQHEYDAEVRIELKLYTLSGLNNVGYVAETVARFSTTNIIGEVPEVILQARDIDDDGDLDIAIRDSESWDRELLYANNGTKFSLYSQYVISSKRFVDVECVPADVFDAGYSIQITSTREGDLEVEVASLSFAGATDANSEEVKMRVGKTRWQWGAPTLTYENEDFKMSVTLDPNDKGYPGTLKKLEGEKLTRSWFKDLRCSVSGRILSQFGRKTEESD